MNATVLDLAHVTPIAALKIQQAGLSDRISTSSGDFFSDAPLPADHDAILLSMIMHDWDEQRDREIIGKCYQALPSGGALIICELLVNDEKTAPAAAALMSLNMLIETEGVRNYTSAEYSAWLKDAGLQAIRTVHFDAPGANGAVVGYKP